VFSNSKNGYDSYIHFWKHIGKNLAREGV
jgi:hypothetical protein